MGKFPFKRPRIISKKFPELDSSIDGVTKSLDDLVFSYHEKVSNALSKKHWWMAFSSIALLLVLGSFISLRGKADTSVFYPETCLGGWINPENAQGEPQTTSNGDETQFTKENSAILPKNTNAEMYCGNFKGKFDAATKPTKIMVSLALTKGADLKLEDTLESGLVATSSVHVPDIATSTTLLEASSSADTSSSSTVESNASSTTSSSSVDTAIATPGGQKKEGPSIIDGVVQSVQDTIHDIFGGNNTQSSQTDTVVVPLPTATDTPQIPQAPTTSSTTGYIQPKDNLLSHFVDTVFAQEDTTTSPAPIAEPASPESIPPQTTPTEVTPGESQTPTDTIKKDEATSTPTQRDPVVEASTSLESNLSATTSETFIIASSSTASSTELTTGTGTEMVATSTDDNQFQNNFLEVFYTFDGVTWISLGELNEISMKYRTFEIPVTASTSWNDLAHLQVKVQAKKHEADTPTVYLDGIKVEVLYETELDHAHPDFSRDTILNDVTMDDIRIVTIINNDTKETEIWYMVLGENSATSTGSEVTVTATSTASSTDVVASSSAFAIATASDTVVGLDNGTTSVSSTSPVLVPSNNLFKRVWKKYHGKDTSLSIASLVEAIKKQEASEKETELDIVPNFASDTIKKMIGVTDHNVLVQIERGNTDSPRDELWLYDTTKNTEERIGKSTTTSSTIAIDSPIGVKGGYLFWVSIDKDIVYAYSLENKTVLEEKIPPYNADKGERAELSFSDVPWRVLYSGETFSFNSTSTGEVFSDEDSTVVETLRASKKLDLVLDKEELSNFNLPVSADTGTGTPK